MSNEPCNSDTKLAALTARVEELDKRLSMRFDLVDRSITVALSAMERRLDTMNEFRSSLRDQAASFADRKELDLRLKPLEEFRANTQGRMQTTVWIVGMVFVIIQIVLRMLWQK